MKRYGKLTAAALSVFLLAGCGGENRSAGVWTVIFAIVAVFLLLIAVTETCSYLSYCKRQKSKGRQPTKRLNPAVWRRYGIGGALLVLSLILGFSGNKAPAELPQTETTAAQTEPAPEPLFLPEKTTGTDPNNWQIRWEIFENGTIRSNYQRAEEICFGDPSAYFALPGISTFRGDPYRSGAFYGTATVTEKRLKTVWTQDTGTIPGGSWSGNGWTGQPLMVQWDAQTRQNMNLYPDKKNKENLVEVIYASLDGRVYFLDLEDGAKTRDPLEIGMCFKGAGTLDPRGYPLLYVGSGDVNGEDKRPRMYIISLIDGKILYEYGYEELLAYRRDNDRWCAFDSGPLIHAQTDTLIWPGENGVLYTIRLNASYDQDRGTVAVAPEEPVLTRYLTERTNFTNYWCGYEASPVIVGNYLYISENGGMFFCVDLNTMELVWAQDTKDDSNSTPVFEPAGDTGGYLYTAPSLHWTKNQNSQGSISIYKLDALTGEILWEVPYEVHTVSGVSGGVQASPVLGRPGTQLEGLILYAIARTNSRNSGALVALDTKTGQERWRIDMDNYSWSSPLAVYDGEGKAYVVLCDSSGIANFIDASGQIVDRLYLGGLVEASPAAYDNMLVVGTRLRKICGIKIS